MNGQDTLQVTLGSYWKHSNGILYQVYDFTNVHSQNPNYPVMISYRGVQNGLTWSRRADDWARSMTLVPDSDLYDGCPKCGSAPMELRTGLGALGVGSMHVCNDCHYSGAAVKVIKSTVIRG